MSPRTSVSRTKHLSKAASGPGISPGERREEVVRAGGQGPLFTGFHSSRNTEQAERACGICQHLLVCWTSRRLHIYLNDCQG